MDFPNTYVVYDLETTGLDPRKDEAVEIGALKVENGEIKEGKMWLLKPTVPVSEEAARVHGITNEIAAGGMHPMDAWEEFAEFAGFNYMLPPWPIIGHNIVRFDNLFVERALAKIGFHLDGFEFFDTAALYKAKYMSERQKVGETMKDFCCRVLDIRAFGIRYKLTDVYAELGGSPEGITAHRAEADVRMTQYVYTQLASKYAADH